MRFAGIVAIGALSAANAQDKAVPDLFRPDPKLTFLETRGQLLPSEAKYVALRVQAIDTFELRVRPVKPQEMVRDEASFARPRHITRVSWPFKIRIVRPRDSLTTWTARLDLESIAERFPGTFLEVKAIAGPRAYRPTIKEANCDSVWAKGRFLVSDLGLVATLLQNDSIQFQTFDLAHSKPWPGIELGRIDKGGKRYRTDSTGRLTLHAPDLSESWLARTSKRPSRIAVVRFEAESWQNLSGSSSSIDFGDGRPKPVRIPEGIRLQPYIFRKLHLPGDTLIVGCVVRMPSGISTANQHLVWTLSAPAGRTIDSGSSLLDSTGHGQWRWPIPEKDWTHDYRVKVSLGDVVKIIEVQVGERKLPRSTVKVGLDPKPSSDAPFGRLRVQARWRTGRPMAGVSLRVRNEYQSIWRDYRTAWSPSWPLLKPAAWVALQEATTDSNGIAELPILQPDVQQVGRVASRLSDVTLLEESGYALETKSNYASRTWTPRPAMVFSQKDDTLLQVKALWFSIADSQIDGRALSASLHWDSEVLASKQIPSGQTWSIPISVLTDRLDDRSVDPCLTVVLCETGTSNCVGESVDTYTADSGQRTWSIPFTWRTSSTERTSSKSPDSTLPADLSPRPLPEGDSAQVRWESRQAGFAWLHVLQGERTLRSEFRPTRAGVNLWKIPTDSTWWPGVQVAVFELSRSTDATNWIRSEGYRLQILRKPTPLGISLETDTNYRPNSLGRIRIRNPLGRTGSVVVSATDQAILDLTDFRMMDPSKTFDAPEAASLTWWNGCGQRQELYGSDESATCSTEPRLPTRALRSRLDPPRPSDVELGGDSPMRSGYVIPRFSTRPLAWVSDVTRLLPGTTDFDIPIPAFLGSARLRAVVSAGRDVVVLDTSILVRSNLEGTLTTPFFLEPGDTTQAVVRVFGKPSLPGVLQMATEGPLQLASSAPTPLVFDSTGTAVRRAEVVALSPEAARIGASLHQGSDSLDLANEMGVRGDRSRHSEVVREVAVDGSIALALPPVFSDSGLRCRMEVSTGPILGLDRRIMDLISFQHSCLEQVVSIALPELFASQLTSEGSAASNRLSGSNLRAALRKLHEFPRFSGLLGLWPHSTQPDTFASIWTAQFLSLEQGNHGRGIQLDLESLAHAIASLRLTDPTEETWRLSLLPRLGFRKATSPEFYADSSSLDSLSSLTLSREARWILAAAWHHRGQTAKSLAERFRARSTPDSLSRKSRQGRASRLRDQAWALEATVALSDVSERDRYLAIVARAIEGDQLLSTQESGSLMIALAKSLPKLEPKTSSFVDWRGAGGTWKKLELKGGRTSVDLPRCTDSLFVRDPQHGPLLRIQSIRKGTLKSPGILRDSGFSVSVKSFPEIPSEHSLIKREGDEFRLQVTIKNTSGQDQTNLAATTWLPAGWILRNDPHAQWDRPIRHVEKRADRIVHHFDLAAGKETTLRIPLRALQSGSYQGPEVVVEALYDNALRGHWMGPRARVETR
ncbi:MAG: hypothetical protein IPO40_10040 [Fibrobacteres bacterium]|nr:hypothetical protein [Fibrobacterota bacterium]